MDEKPRFQSFEEFWPYYLSQHRDPRSRWLHFIGTTGWVASLGASLIMRPTRFSLAMAAFGSIATLGAEEEAKGAPLKHVALLLAIPSFAAPLTFPGGVAFAYGCAWLGHFFFEKNRPATFEYPIWSFFGDLRMWSLMLRGKLWSGDPLEALGLKEPTSKGDEVPGIQVKLSHPIEA
ncbi:MAG: DUF962 domain-containing protein [Sandaracinaceae bacterium]|nr:DUF962 domain-containing protein [Sandaracinaceae bacterium]MDW8246587.1 DUF962 domain-containing protein [Sandaracinaceae bacterium]